MECPMATSTPPVSILFGPQCSDIEQTTSNVRSYLKKSSSQFIHASLQDLPAFWLEIIKAWPPLSQIPGDEQIVTLLQYLQSSDPGILKPTSIIQTLLTVLSHISDFEALKTQVGEKNIIDTQGFCIGFLPAIAVARSRSENDFQKATATIMRLALCIGALVDLDELCHGRSRSIAVRWKCMADLKTLHQVLATYPNAYIACVFDTNRVTVTVPDLEVDCILTDLKTNTLSTKVIETKGRFHNEVYDKAVKRIHDHFKDDIRWRVPGLGTPRLPLRSNIDGEEVGDGDISAIALKSILVRRCEWIPTVTGSFNTISRHDDARFLTVGNKSIIPRSVASRIAHSRIFRHPSQHDHRDYRAFDHVNGMGSDFLQKDPMGVNSHLQEPTPPIAIVGMACRYPQANSVEELWDMLELGKSAASELPNGRFKMNEFPREPRGPFWGNFLDQPDVFDHRFFGISAREAESMDPQQRLLLEVAYNAMESAGYCGLSGSSFNSDIGCYIGVGSDDYTDNVGSQHATAYSATGTLQAFNSGRISHFFGWTGPSLIVDTACSSSAVAIHLACKALLTKECSIAVAGGVNVMTSPKVTQNLAAASFLSPTGASRAFDANANGYCRGEGAGLVVLRPLDDALRNKDSVLAVISGSAVNQGSNCSPITVPVSDSQQSLYQKVLDVSSTSARQVTYVEAHGTGTQTGDPIEFDSIRQVFGGANREEKLFVGSIKDNIGHTETSSGVAALLKTVMMIQKGRIPKQANFSRLNPKITCHDDDNIVIPQRSTDWLASELLAMVTNYGASGSNAALLIKEPPKAPEDAVLLRGRVTDVPIIISAKSPESLRAYCDALRQFAIKSVGQSSSEFVVDLAYALATKQNRKLDYVATFTTVSRNPQNLLDKLSSLASINASEPERRREPLPVVLCFGGQTGNAASISEDIFNSSILLQLHLVECDRTCKKLGLPSIFPKVFQTSTNEDLVSLHCILFSIQYACAKTWMDSGLQISCIIGHSFGQLTGLCVAGGLSLSDGITLVSQRANLIQNTWGPERGVMLSIQGPEHEVQDLLNRSHEKVDISCFNGPQDLVIAGGEASIAEIEKMASTEKSNLLKTKKLGSTHGFHSRLVDAILPGLKVVAESLDYRPCQIPIQSCSEYDDWSSVTPNKILEHSRMPVYFQAAVERTAKAISGPAIWLEAGSNSPIIPMIRRIVKGSQSPPGHFFQSMNLEGSQAQQDLSKATSNLWYNGVDVQFWPFHKHQSASYQSLNLPPYQFKKTRHWISFDPAAFLPTSRKSPVENGSEIVSRLEGNSEDATFSVNVAHPMYRSCAHGHEVVGEHLCPASLYIELILKAASEINSDEISGIMPHIQNLQICTPLTLESDGVVRIRLSRSNNQSPWNFSLFSQRDKTDLKTHATGEIALHKVSGTSRVVSRFRSLNRLIEPSHALKISRSPSCHGLIGSPVYQTFDQVVKYADYYHGVKNVFASGTEATGFVSLEQSNGPNGLCDPVLIDNFLQVAGIHTNCLSQTRDDEVFVCSALDDIFVSDIFLERASKSARTGTVYTNYERPSNKQFICDIFVVDPDTDQLMVALMSATFNSVLKPNLSRALKRLNKNTEICETQANAVDWSIADQILVSENLQDLQNVAVTSGGGIKLVQEMFHILLGIPVGELLPSSELQDIGVDSLMRTEVTAEIKKRFNVNLPTSALMEIPNIEELTRRIFADEPSSSTISVSARAHVATKASSEKTNKHTDQHGEVNGDSSVQDDHCLAEVSQNAFTSIKTSTDHSQMAQWAGFCHSVWPKQEALVTSYVVEAFRAMNAPLESIKSGQPIPQIEVLSRHQKVKGRLYSILEEAKLITRVGSGFIRSEQPVPTTSSSELHDQIVREYPQHASEHRLLQTTGCRLAQCLNGTTDPLEILFQDTDARELLGDVYTNAPMFRSATMHLTQYLRSVLGEFTSSRKIKILEIGAGTGGTTGYLLNQLADTSGLAFEYTFTDISPSLIALARKRFKAYDFMQYTTLDVNQEPARHMLGQYDVVISSNCVHATPSITRSIENIRKHLRPDGILCLIELTRNLSWFDLVFGLLDGWWLFDDRREHALASELVWDKALRQAGYKWVDWSSNSSKESEILRLIVASPTCVTPLHESLILEETVTFATRGGIQLLVDIHYPVLADERHGSRPIALMIHGGGHVMLSRKDIRPKQTQLLLDAGFLPVSIDYRLCPEVSLKDGPMSDCRDALVWARNILPSLALQRSDIKVDGNQVVAVGWSTGGHLAMTLAWTSLEVGIRPPEAILSFYSPTDYEDSFWREPNLPFGRPALPDDAYNPWQGIKDAPITSYNPPSAIGGWMAPKDARSCIALHMNMKGQTLPVLIGPQRPTKNTEGTELEFPSHENILLVSPLAQIRSNRYKTPTFLIHGTLDDLIPVSQAERTFEALLESGVDAEFRCVDAKHLFDIYPDEEQTEEMNQAVEDGFAFLRKYVNI